MRVYFRSNRRNSTFGVVLADLMLNAVGGLTLLLIPLLHQVDEAGSTAAQLQVSVTAQATELARKEELVASAQRQIDAMHRNQVAHEETQERLTKALQESEKQLRVATPVDVVFVIDASLSMEQQIQHVETAIWQAAELLPRITRFRIGMLVFFGSGQQLWPLQEVMSPQRDGGQSRDRVKAFLESIKLQNGVVDVASATSQAITFFEPQPDRQIREVLVLVSDVGPGDVNGINVPATRVMRTAVEGWVNSASNNRRFVALFGHHPTYVAPGYVPEDHRQAYQFLAAMKGGRYADQPAAIFPVLFEAMLDKPSEED